METLKFGGSKSAGIKNTEQEKKPLEEGPKRQATQIKSIGMDYVNNTTTVLSRPV